MPLFKATVELFVDVEDHSQACDAVAEMLRPLIRAWNEDSCLIDWQYPPNTPRLARPDEIEELEHAP